MKKISTFYWITTIIVSLLFIMNVFMYLTRDPQIVNGMNHLGYPVYLIDMLAVAKIIAVIILLVPGIPRLKEWAYAGLTIDLVGAAWSHLAIGDSSAMAFIITDTIFLAASYYFLRRLQQQHSSKVKPAI